MKNFPNREPPDMMLRGPHEAVPLFHTDWTQAEGPHDDPDRWARELSLRDSRNMWLREFLELGRKVFYTSSGNSLWPLVQSGDGCVFHPIQAVPAEMGVHGFQKEESPLGVGDIVFCQVQPSCCYYAHIVLAETADDQGTWYVIGTSAREEAAGANGSTSSASSWMW